MDSVNFASQNDDRARSSFWDVKSTDSNAVRLQKMDMQDLAKSVNKCPQNPEEMITGQDHRDPGQDPWDPDRIKVILAGSARGPVTLRVRLDIRRIRITPLPITQRALNA